MGKYIELNFWAKKFELFSEKKEEETLYKQKKKFSYLYLIWVSEFVCSLLHEHKKKKNECIQLLAFALFYILASYFLIASFFSSI